MSGKKNFEHKPVIKDYGVVSTDCPHYRGMSFHKGMSPIIMVILFGQLMTIPVYGNEDADEFRIRLVDGVLRAESI